MEEKKKRRHLGGTSDGREEEAGMPNPRTSSDCNWASIILAAVEREWIVPMMRNLSAVAQKSDATSTCFGFWLKEEEAPFSPYQGEEMSWVFVSLVLTRPFWISKIPKAFEEGVAPSPSFWPWPYHPLRLSHTGSGDFGHNWRVRNLKSLKGLQIKEMTSHRASYMGGKPGGI